MRYVFEIFENSGDRPCFVGELIRREADRVMMHYRGGEITVELSLISNCFTVDDDRTNQKASERPHLQPAVPTRPESLGAEIRDICAEPNAVAPLASCRFSGGLPRVEDGS